MKKLFTILGLSLLTLTLAAQSVFAADVVLTKKFSLQVKNLTKDRNARYVVNEPADVLRIFMEVENLENKQIEYQFVAKIKGFQPYSYVSDNEGGVVSNGEVTFPTRLVAPYGKVKQSFDMTVRNLTVDPLGVAYFENKGVELTFAPVEEATKKETAVKSSLTAAGVTINDTQVSATTTDVKAKSLPTTGAGILIPGFLALMGGLAVRKKRS